MPTEATEATEAARAPHVTEKGYISVICSASLRPRSTEAFGKLSIVDREKTNIGDRDLSPPSFFY